MNVSVPQLLIFFRASIDTSFFPDEAHRDTFNGAPIGLQLIGKRFQEEKLLLALDLVDGAVNGAFPTSN